MGRFGQAQSMGYARSIPGAVATAGVDERMAFVRRTYAHLGGAIGLFVLLEYAFLQTTLAVRWTEWALGTSWLLVIVLFIGVAWLAERWAHSDTSRAMQYVGLGLYIVAEVVIFAPLLLIASYAADNPYLIHKAGLITLLLFAGLTGTVFITKKDFSFLRGILAVESMVALGIIVVSLIWGFALGTLFSAAMVMLAAGFILYDTSQVLAHYRPTQHVAAALALFASVALMFWYVLQLLMSLSRD